MTDTALSQGGPVVTAIVVTHNNEALIERCLDAIDTAVGRRSYETIVVDNGSVDATAERACKGRAVRCVELEQNLGFAAANNVAIAMARGRYLALVNSDCFPDPESIDVLIDFMDCHPEAGIVGARLRYPSGALQPSTSDFPSLLGGLWVACLLHRAPGLARLGIGVHANPALYRRARRVDWVTAAFCVARREVGPLPARAFMYGEDVEWARSALEQGYTTWLEPCATAVHIGAGTVRDVRRAGFRQVQRVAFELRWFGRRGCFAAVAARAILALHASVRLAPYVLLYPVRPERARVGIAEFATLMRSALALDGRGDSDISNR
jgi:GT2 family glycosyltransferase